MVIAAVTLVAVFDIFAAGHLRIAEGVFATCRLFGYAPLVVLLWVQVSPKSSAREVFGHFRDLTGTWPSAGLSALVGQVTGMFVNSRSDALAHLAEEVEDAAVVVPKGMVWSYVLVSWLLPVMIEARSHSFAIRVLHSRSLFCSHIASTLDLSRMLRYLSNRSVSNGARAQ